MRLVRPILRKIGITAVLKRLVIRPYLEWTTVMQVPPFPSEVHEPMVDGYDYVRYCTVALAIHTIATEHIPGSFAELGVYKGEMSRLIHSMAPERVYYLFDTFSGFPQEDLDRGMEEDKRFRDTSVDLVLRTIGDTQNIVIRKGRVPQTLSGLEDERFAFVLLDLDHYLPTRSSLEFFYPRMSRGGYVFIHDYNNGEFNWGCRRAAEEFLVGKPERIVEVSDRWGTALFRKI